MTTESLYICPGFLSLIWSSQISFIASFLLSQTLHKLDPEENLFFPSLQLEHTQTHARTHARMHARTHREWERGRERGTEREGPVYVCAQLFGLLRTVEEINLLSLSSLYYNYSYVVS